jgi:hypothetical protein
VIKVKAVEWRRPLGKEPYEPACLHPLAGLHVKQIGEADSLLRGLQHHGGVASDEGAFNIYLEGFAASLELPAIDVHGAWPAKANARISMQIARALWLSQSLNELGMCDHHGVSAAAYSNRDHVLFECLAKTNASIKSTPYDVGKYIVDGDVECHGRIGLVKRLQMGSKHMHGRDTRKVKPQQTSHFVPLAVSSAIAMAVTLIWSGVRTKSR